VRVIAEAFQGSLVETLRLRKSTDDCEFYAAVVRLCRDAGVFPGCVSRCSNGIEVYERPHLHLVPPMVAGGGDMWPVVMAACHESPANSQGYTEYCKACGLPSINWWDRRVMRLWTVGHFPNCTSGHCRSLLIPHARQHSRYHGTLVICVRAGPHSGSNAFLSSAHRHMQISRSSAQGHSMARLQS